MLNKVTLIGNLGADPEVKLMPTGDSVTNITLATSMRWKDKQTGERKESTEWHRVVFFRRLAEIVGEYLKKGSQVYVEGHLRTRKWKDQAGVDRYTTEIIADEMHMLGSRSDATGSVGNQMSPNYSVKQDNYAVPAKKMDNVADMPLGLNYDDMDDDIPF